MESGSAMDSTWEDAHLDSLSTQRLQRKIAKTIYSQLPAKAASNMRRKQSSFVYVRDPFDFDQSESDEQFKSEDFLRKNKRKRQVRKNYS